MRTTAAAAGEYDMEKNAVNVLFLEDEPTIREVLAEYMKLSGYQVTEIDRGDNAIELLQENR